MRDLLLILKRRKWIFLAVVGSILAGFSWMLRFEPRLYSATASLLVTKSFVRPIVSDAHFTPVVSPDSPFLQAQMALLTSPTVFQRAAQKIRDRRSPLAQAEKLQEMVSLRSEEKEQNLFVTATGDKPKELLEAVRALADAIQEYSKELARVEYDEADRMMGKLIEENRNAIEDHQKALEALKLEFEKKTEFKIGSGGFERESDRLAKEVDGLETSLKQLGSSQSILEHKIKSLGTLPDGEMDLTKISLAIDLSPNLDGLRKQIIETRAQVARLRAAFTDKHPEVRSALAGLKTLADQLDQARQERLAEIKDEKKVASSLLDQAKASLEKLAAFRTRFLREQRELEIVQEMQTWLARTHADLRLGQSMQTGNVHAIFMPTDAAQIRSGTQKAWPFVVLLAFLVGGVLAYICEYLDDTLQTEYQVGRFLNLDVVGHFPYLAEEDKRFIGGLVPSHPVVETFNRMAARILSIADQLEKKPQIMLVASPCQEEGKSTVASNLAVAFAYLGQRVILVDADLRKSRLHRILDVPNEIGLSNYLSGKLDAREQLHQILEEEAVQGSVQVARSALDRILLPTSVSNLRLVPAGPSPANPMQVLESPKFAEFLDSLRKEADRILIDSPPLQAAADAVRLASRADASLMIIAAGRTRRHEADWAKHFLVETQTPLLGAILNMVQPSAAGYSYYYYYGYDDRDKRERI